ncbi:Metallo-dependent phosphatase [Pseudovirgaria hyperparasitica]|uniref:Metallo-dependent phosphatase n=1 Tax=Pseudovirgaria hyperparasitica TaxID=470096 RepID=A0A6A6W7J7_9PEZI|nr:Metallo-dependent phosphatase [Pseudovirgaria hyperparasitica]KAF2757856.1 Metallo-dependent phosphatase [Pseudovirgaria hyperparasitica]
MTSYPSTRPVYRKTRFVCISDTHNQTPKLPAGDVLIHAGDLTNQGSLSELQKTVAWLEKANFEAKIVVAGNHDITLDSPFYQEHGAYFHNQQPQDPLACQELLKSSPTITYLQHETRDIYLSSPTGPQTVFTVFGSPYSPAQGSWGFQYNKDRAATIWDAIPLNASVVVTHAPPFGHCDYSAGGRSKGCEALRKALWRVRPMLSVCGHTHEGRGIERVTWKMDLPLCPYLEDGYTFWDDPGAGTNKLSYIDLTEKGGKKLDNYYESKHQRQLTPNRVSFSPPPEGASLPSPTKHSMHSHKTALGRARCRSNPNRKKSSSRSRSRSRSRRRAVPGKDARTRDITATDVNTDSKPATEARGRQPSNEVSALEEWYSRLDGLNISAMAGREGKKETCIINAAICGTSWGQGPRKFNKPIVVDLDLPVWDGAPTLNSNLSTAPP